MAIGGIGGSIGPALQPGHGAVQRPEEAQRRPQAFPTPKSPEPAQPNALADDGSDVPAEAPPGTDPVMWSVLTAEERLYFTRLHTLGPLTYGRRPAPAQAGVARGARIDRTV
jgi:hypothetical protein